MKLKNIKISTQLHLGFSLVLFLVLILGAVSYNQTHQIHLQTETMYNHPLSVQRALGHLTADILSMRVSTRDLMLAKNKQEQQDAILLIDVSSADAFQQFNTLNASYLGPAADVEAAFKSFVLWEAARAANIKLALSGDIETVKRNILPTGEVGLYRNQMLEDIEKLHDFARQKADSLYTDSKNIETLMKNQLALLVSTIIFLALLTGSLLLRHIREPLQELIETARGLNAGEMQRRSRYESKNEFGELSAAFNAMAESIQRHINLNQKSAALANIMLSHDDAEQFFQATLTELATQTHSQLAAVYLLSTDKKSYEHFASLGMEDQARTAFAADRFEGEFGLALMTREVQHVKEIPQETRFLFHTTTGTFIPREIITIPIANNDVLAVISLATLGSYNQQGLQLIEKILPTLTSRIEGILAYRKMKAFSAQLEHQNRELETQRSEMAEQATELTAQNYELEIQKKQLDEASRLKTNFLANMSHELRTPLNSVIALSGVLSRRLSHQIPEEEHSYLEVIERNGKHLLSLINDVLDIARIESGREEFEITTFNLGSLLAEVTGMIRPQATQKGIELRLSTAEINLTVSSDAGKCRHILQNLLANAVKFTDKGEVTINARQNGESMEISVADTGIGIQDHHLHHIFDEFRQADSSTSRKFGGTGLGLAIAQKYAHLLGGTISVKSTVGEGSEFTLILPLDYSEEGRIIAADARDLHPAIIQAPQRAVAEVKGKTILLVEDSDPAIIQLKDFLEENGYQILVAHDGAEALGIIEQTIPDAIILDLMMPGIDGFAVLQTIRDAERTAHIPVLILSAKHISKDELKLLKRNNIHQLIQKGDVNRNELQNAVRTMVTPTTVATIQPRRPRPAIEGRPLVLVVEDNPDNMITVKALLAEDYYTVIEAVDGITGIKMAKEQRPHLILMDIALPGMDGIEAFKTIRNIAHLQHIPVIALTASAMTSDRESILAHGFDAYISKPINDQLFFRSIHEVLYGE